MKNINWVLATINVLLNINFLPVTLLLFLDCSSPMGFSWMIAGVSLALHLPLVGAFLAFRKKYCESDSLAFLQFTAMMFGFAILYFTGFPSGEMLEKLYWCTSIEFFK